MVPITVAVSSGIKWFVSEEQARATDCNGVMWLRLHVDLPRS